MTLFIKIMVFCPMSFAGKIFCEIFFHSEICIIIVEANILKSECILWSYKAIKKVLPGSVVCNLEKSEYLSTKSLSEYFHKPTQLYSVEAWWIRKKSCWICLLLFTPSHLHGVVAYPAKGILIHRHLIIKLLLCGRK